jgi:hypothetical protein
MVSVSDVIDSYDGMITKAQAAAIVDNSNGIAGKQGTEDITTIKALSEFFSMIVKQNMPLLGKQSSKAYKTNIQDHIYRIFNPVEYALNGRQNVKRTIVLGSEGSTMKFNIKGKLSDFIDSNAFERGDMVIVKNAVLDTSTGELSSISSTMINKVMPSTIIPIYDYSTLKEGMKNIDIVGKILELGPIRYVNKLSGSGQIAVVDCMLSNMSDTIKASLWGSSATITAKFNVGDFMKIEFCNVIKRNNSLEIYASDLSRVVSNKLFERKIHS